MTGQFDHFDWENTNSLPLSKDSLECCRCGASMNYFDLTYDYACPYCDSPNVIEKYDNEYDDDEPKELNFD